MHHFFTHQASTEVWESLIFLLLADIVGCVLLALPRVGRAGPGAAALLLLAGTFWARADHTVEGGILVTLTPAHGIVVADMLSVQAGFTALALLLRWVVEQRRGRGGPGTS
jgi:hypothetical protein